MPALVLEPVLLDRRLRLAGRAASIEAIKAFSWSHSEVELSTFMAPRRSCASTDWATALFSRIDACLASSDIPSARLRSGLTHTSPACVPRGHGPSE